MAAVEQRIEYKRELRSGDVVTIRSTVLGVHDKAIRLRHEMTNDETGDLAAVTEIVGVHIEMTARRTCSLPSDVRERAILMNQRQSWSESRRCPREVADENAGTGCRKESRRNHN
jgi:acyl-CoA thioesterase FadM